MSPCENQIMHYGRMIANSKAKRFNAVIFVFLCVLGIFAV